MTPTAVISVQTTRARPGHRTPRAAETAMPHADPSADFALYVRGQLDGPVLRYSQRLALLKEAGRRGVGRFEANLVIASVLHARGMGQEYELRPTPGRKAPLLAGLAVQLAVVVGAWWVWH